MVTLRRTLAIILALAATAAPLRAQWGFMDALPKEEYAAHRAAVFARIGDGVAIVQGSAEWPSYQKFRQNAQFLYLTGVEVPRAIVVLDGRAKRTTLYLPKRTERMERSEGPLLGPGDAARAVTGADEVLDIAAFGEAVTRFGGERRTLWLPHRQESRFMGAPEASRNHEAATLGDKWDGRLTREAAFIENVRKAAPGVTVEDLDKVLDELRMVKSPREIALIREATRQASLAMIEAMRSTEPGLREIELEAIGDYVFKRNDSQSAAYYGLVAADTNAFWPHYHEGRDTLKAGQLVLFDYAPDFKYYTSDVTRMMPVSGRWTAEQKERYTAYLRLYQALMTSIRPNVAPKEVIAEAVRKMDAWMASQTFKSAKNRAAAERFVDGYRKSTRNSLGHMVGMEVHDAAVPYETLKPGMVFTIEPALTIPEDRVYIRLEDVILVTETGYENLSDMAPVEPEQIERVMKERGILQVDTPRKAVTVR
ncbi:MAG: Xaa-Pro peptidase family protein [Gemmatimonadales bacterium]|nr:Xaa-Pro peptidase family protein [Gemmatimonadales bacterium]